MEKILIWTKEAKIDQSMISKVVYGNNDSTKSESAGEGFPQPTRGDIK